MKNYQITLLRNGIRSVEQIYASSVEEAKAQLAPGALVLEVKASRLARRARPFPLTLFIQELIALLDAGLVIVEAIEALCESSSDNEQRRVLTEILKELYRGQQLSQALAAQPQLFPPFGQYRRLVRADRPVADRARAFSALRKADGNVA